MGVGLDLVREILEHVYMLGEMSQYREKGRKFN